MRVHVPPTRTAGSRPRARLLPHASAHVRPHPPATCHRGACRRRGGLLGHAAAHRAACFERCRQPVGAGSCGRGGREGAWVAGSRALRAGMPAPAHLPLRAAATVGWLVGGLVACRTSSSPLPTCARRRSPPRTCVPRPATAPTPPHPHPPRALRHLVTERTRSRNMPLLVDTWCVSAGRRRCGGCTGGAAGT